METYCKDVPERMPGTEVDRHALEARIKDTKPLEVGAPDQMLDTPLHTQGSDPDCLLQSARMAEQAQTGRDPGLEAYKVPAIEKGAYDRYNGTDVDRFMDVINDRPGIEADLTYHNGPQDIKDALDEGHSVIACVDTFEFYKGQYNFEHDGSGHAVVVTGADETSDGSWRFTVNDPNETMPDIPVDGDRFLRAWNRVDRPMIAVQRAGGF